MQCRIDHVVRAPQMDGSNPACQRADLIALSSLDSVNKADLSQRPSARGACPPHHALGEDTMFHGIMDGLPIRYRKTTIAWKNAWNVQVIQL